MHGVSAMNQSFMVGVYSLKTGLIKDLNVSFDSSAKLPSIFRVDRKQVDQQQFERVEEETKIIK